MPETGSKKNRKWTEEGLRMDHKKNRAGQTDSMIHNEQGVALIYALVVMAVIVALALALLYGVGQVSLMTGSHRDQEDCYLQALTLSEAIEAQLTTATGGGIYDAAKSYMPDSDSDSTEESIQFTAEGLSDDYGRSVIRFQNGVEAVNETHDWESKQLSNQYLDLTVEVFGKRGGKESVTTRYRFYRKLDDDDMEYTGAEAAYTCKYVSSTGADTDYFIVYDPATYEVKEERLKLKNETVTMELAERWAGAVQDGGIERISIMDASGEVQSIHAAVQIKLTRQRKLLGFGEGAESEYKGKELKFQKINTR